MKKDGELLEAFISNQKISVTQIAKDLGMSRKNLYQFYDSTQMDNAKKIMFEDYFKVSIFKHDSVDTDSNITDPILQYVYGQEGLPSKAQTYQMFQNLEKNNTGLVEANKNFSIAAVKFATSNEKLVNNNSELINMLKALVPALNSLPETRSQTSPWQISIDPESMAQAGVGKRWDTIEEGRAVISELMASSKQHS